MDSVVVEISVRDCRVMYTAVCDSIQHWPGSPQRDPEEQQSLLQMKSFWFSILCESAYNKS